LGLYICRELCERHRASIGYQRASRERSGLAVQGNEFFVQFRPPKPSTLVARPFDIQPV
jgi:two-component system sensor histidine kinase PilS (NtrC family)